VGCKKGKKDEWKALKKNETDIFQRHYHNHRKL